MAKKTAKPKKKRASVPIRRSPVYTRSGDEGLTDIPRLGRVGKNHPLVEASGSLDELNCLIGFLAASIATATSSTAGMRAASRRLRRIQNELFIVGSLVSGTTGGGKPARTRLRSALRRLETEIDAMESELPACRGFVIPGSEPLSAAAHVARATCRRAERACIKALADDPLRSTVVPYINRLSDWLFVLARWLVRACGGEEHYWPGPSLDKARGKRR